MFIFDLFTKQPEPNTSMALSERQYWLTLLPPAHVNQNTSCDLPIQTADTKKLIKQQINLCQCSTDSVIRSELRWGMSTSHPPLCCMTFPQNSSPPLIKTCRLHHHKMHISCFLNESHPVGMRLLHNSGISLQQAPSYNTVLEKHQKAERGQHCGWEKNLQWRPNNIDFQRATTKKELL